MLKPLVLHNPMVFTSIWILCSTCNFTPRDISNYFLQRLPCFLGWAKGVKKVNCRCPKMLSYSLGHSGSETHATIVSKTVYVSATLLSLYMYLYFPGIGDTKQPDILSIADQCPPESVALDRMNGMCLKGPSFGSRCFS